MGDRDHQSPQAPPHRGASLRGPTTRARRLAAVVLLLAGLWSAGAAVLLRRLEERRDARIAETVAGARGVLQATQSVLLREARLLAQDPTIAAGVAKSEWATLAGGVSPRTIALTVDRLADLLVVLDARGTTLLQVPALPAVSLGDLPAPAAPTVLLRTIDGAAYLLAAAPIRGPGDAPVGVALVGRQLARLEGALAMVAGRPALVALAGPRLLGATRADLPTGGWEAAANAGVVELAGEPWALRALGAPAEMWALIPDTNHRAERMGLHGWLVGSFVLAAAAAVAAAWLAGRSSGRRGVRGLDSRTLQGAATLSSLELAHLLEINKKLSAAADSTERLQRAVAEEAAQVLNVDNAGFRLLEGDELVLAGVTGTADQTMLRPRLKVGESFSGRVAAEGRTIVANIADLPGLLPEHRAADARLGYRTCLGVPLRLGERIIGVCVFRSRRRFTAQDRELAEAFADQAALVLENARLFSREAARRAWSEMVAQVEQEFAAELNRDRLFQLIVQRAGRLFSTDAVIHWAEPQGLAPQAGPAPALAAGPVPMGQGPVGRCAQERRGVLVDGVMAQPLILREQLLGVLSVSRPGEAAPFSAEELALLEALAARAAIAIENARLHDETEQRRREAEVLAELARTIGASLDTETVLLRVIEGARELCGSDLARIALRDGNSDYIVVRYGVGTRYQRYGTLRIEPGKGISGQVLVTGRPFRTDHYAADPRFTKDYLPVAQEEGVVAELAVPIRIGERVAGVLNVDNRAARVFTDRHEAVLQQLADHAALAIQNARLYAALEVRATRLRVLAHVNRTVSSSLDIYEVLRTIACAASELMGGVLVAFWVADESTRTLKVSGFSDDVLGADFPIGTVAFGEAAVGWVAAHRQPLNISDVFGDERCGGQAWARTHGLSSFMGVPILLQDSLLGVLTLHGRAPFTVGLDDQSLLESFVAQAAVALDHARLYADTSRRLEETRALLEVAEILNSTLDPRQLLERVAIKIARVCRVDRCSIGQWNGQHINPLMSQLADSRDGGTRAPEEALTAYAPADVAAHAVAIESRRPVLIDNTANTELIPPAWAERYGVKSQMVMPLIRQEQVIGVLSLDYRWRATPFQPWQVNLATAIAGQLALALENARLYSEAQERLRETTTLLAVGQVLSQPGVVEETLRRVTREVAQALGADTVGAYALDESGQVLQPLAGYRVPSDLREVFLTHPISLERHARLLRDWDDGKAIWSSDPHHDDRFDQALVGRLPPHTVLIAPTSVRGESRGCLILCWWHTGHRLEPAEIRLIEGIAAQVGLAIDNVELARQREARLKETETLLAVSRVLSSTLDLDTLLRHFMQHITGAIGADGVGVWMLDETGQWLTPRAGYQMPPEWTAIESGHRRSLAAHPFYAEAVRTKRAVFASDVAADPRIPSRLAKTMPHRSQLFVPIVAKERVIAGFIAVWRDRPRAFAPGELLLMEAIASQAGVAVENARLFEQNRRQVEELSVLHELSRAVTGQLDQRAVLDAIRTQVGRMFEVHNMVVALRTESGIEVPLDLRHGQQDPALPQHYRLGAGLSSAVLSTGRAIRTDDYLGECARRGVAPVPGVEVFKHWLGVPMRAGQSVLGVLALRSAERPYSAADENLLTNIADLAALALRSARLFEERTRAYGELAAAQDHLVRTEKLRALGEMASGVAHDFNNLLAAILGRTQLVLRRIDDPMLRRWLEVIERSAMDGAQTVRRLQEFARIRRDQPMVPIDLNEVVRDALEITQSRWREDSLRRGVTIDVQTALGPLPPVAGDPAELREALTNLILNAVDAMPQGGTLNLSSAVVDGRVEIAVSDTGVGIPDSVREKIFDPFFTTKGPQGTGLGLSMTYGILSRHGAGIAVESSERGGSTFRLSFPTTETTEARPPVIPPALPMGAAFRCLVVDDEEAVGAVIGDVLETVGHKAVVLTDGAAAIERLRSEAFDVVFTDLAMPGVSGWQVARAVKELAPGVPVFLVTGFGVELSAPERAVHGVEAVFSKPLKIDDIVEAIAQVARKRAGLPAGEEP